MTEERREYDRMIGELMAELRMTREAVAKLETKVDDLIAIKNKGLGVILAVGMASGGFAALLNQWIDWKSLK